MTKVKLGAFIQEYSVKNKKDLGYPVYSVTNSKGFCTEYFNKDVSGEDKTSYKIVPRGYFAYNPSRINIGSIDWQNSEDNVIVSPLYIVFKCSDELNQDYLKYYLRSESGKRTINARVSGAVRNNLKFSVLSDFEINIGSMEEQQAVVDILKKLEDAIDNERKQVNLFDELIKSRFVEIFGDPISNPNRFPVVKLGELSELITKGASPSWQGFSYTEDSSQTLFVTSENVREGYIDLSAPKYVEDGFNEKHKRSVIHKGDFLINIVGASIGRAAQFNYECKANMNQAAALVRVNDSRVRDKYLLAYLNSEKAQVMYESMKSETGRANLSLQNISDLSVLLPSVEQQIVFESFVECIEKSKAESQKRIALYKELLVKKTDELFTGET